MAHTGVIKWFDRKKGFGFVTPNEGGDDIFVHRLNLPSDGGAPILDEGDVISYNLGTHKDRPTAIDVVMPEGKPRRRRGRGAKKDALEEGEEADKEKVAAATAADPSSPGPKPGEGERAGRPPREGGGRDSKSRRNTNGRPRRNDRGGVAKSDRDGDASSKRSERKSDTKAAARDSGA